MVNRQRRAATLSVLYLTCFLMTGCALSPKVPTVNPTSSYWQGRLALRIDADEVGQAPRSVSAGFELTGNAIEGTLTLYTPLGGTAAVLMWSEHDASLLAQSELQHFPSLKALIEQAVGTDVPVEALFAWLAGTLTSADGWTVDLTDHANGRITAKRSARGPEAELRIVLDR